MPNSIKLKQQKAALLAGDKPPRAREAAKQLNISEAEYVALSCGESTYLLDKNSLTTIFLELHRIGEVMALTRNDAVVLEHHGIYNNPVIKEDHIVISETDMDLRLQISDWQYGFAVDEGGRQSFQFFDMYGQAVHKIYMTKNSNLQVYDDLASQFTVDGGFEHMSVKQKVPQPKVDRPLGNSAIPLQAQALQPLFEKAVEDNWSLLMHVPNGSATQIHNGSVHKLLTMGPWFNVLDPKFNMHASLQLINEAWLVVKKTNGESAVSLELFDANDNAVMMMYLQPSSSTPEIIKQWEDFLITQKVEGITV